MVSGLFRCISFVRDFSVIINLYLFLSIFDPVPPKFDIEPARRSEANEGTKLSLKCMASGSPLPKIEWKVRGSNVVLASGIRSKELLFNSINRRNQSEYQCIATNVAGKVTKTAQVIVNCEY